MDPSTGNILSMANYPNFNLNTPFTPNGRISEETWDELSPIERNDFLFNMWHNTSAQSTFEPGSTFKFITAAAGIEEGIVGLNSPRRVFLFSALKLLGGLRLDAGGITIRMALSH